MAETAEETQVDLIINPIIRRLKIIGFPLDNVNIWTKIWWNYIILSNVTWIVLSCFHLMKAANVEVICDVVLNVSCLSQLLAGLLTIHIFRNILQETLNNMKTQFWFHETKFDEAILAKHRIYYRILSSIGSGYQGICYGCIAVWFLEPIINTTGRFPMDMSFPYRNFIKEFPYFEITYVIQAIAVPIGASLVVLLDIVYITSLGFVLIQIDLIKQKLKMLISDNDDEKKIYEKLKECIIHHNIVLDSMKKIEEFYKYLMLDKLLCDILCLCVTTYLFSEQQTLNIKFILILAASGSQPLLYCFFGDFVTSECASIGEEAYEINWQNYGYKSITSALSMMILRSQKQVLMSAGGMIVFSLPNYVAFMKMMVSFYLVLKHE